MDNVRVKRLLILRHGKSDWGDSSLDDWHRPLSARGLTDAPRVGEVLRAQSLVPDLIVTSDAVRARSTAEAVAQAAGYPREVVLEAALYLATPDTIIAVVSALDDSAESALIVGHNPGLEDVIQVLSGEDHEMPTAALAQLALPIERWSDLDASIGATVTEYWRPKG